MKAQELRGLTNADLAQKLDESYQEMFNLRFQRATGKLTNTARIHAVRKEIARVKTILRERELAETA
ncbi:MAG: 50S ribosomal protein L29 [Caldilineaceae bacterium]|nr:50S ribosomal protein L29 [Caldilineaceae bacterium]